MTSLALAAALVLSASSDSETMRLRPGAHSVLRTPGLTKVAIADPEVADVQVSAGELLVLGRRRGRTTMTLWYGSRVSTRSLVVDDGSTDDIARLVHDLVDPSLHVEAFEDKVVIDGKVDSLQDLRRLEQLVGDDPRVKLMVRVDPAAIRVLAETITQALHKNGMPSAQATAVGSKIVLEGSVSDLTERDKAQTIADSYYSGFVAAAH
jgi:pilus assembly protein CpaC